MNINITDRMLNCIIAKTDVPNTIRSYFPEWISGCFNVVCPFHDDTDPSLHISENGKAHCFGCNWSACNIVDLCSKMEGLAYSEMREVMYKQIVNAIPGQKAFKFHKNLMKNDKALDYVLRKRMITQTQVTKYQLGLDPNTERITVPIYDQFGYLVNIRYIAWDKPSKFKVINDNGHGAARLYPEVDLVKHDKVLLVEGEWDCLIGKTFGLPAITWTGGAGSWDHQYDWMFKNKLVFVLYDNDEAGKAGTQQAVEALRKVAHYVIIPPPLVRGKDLSDWLRKEPSLAVGIMQSIIKTKLPEIKQTKTCPCCGQEVK
jgi:DNA primase